MMHNVGRLAMRVEGDWWVAYYAATNTMDEAIELGRVLMRIVADENRKQAFMGIMKDCIGEFVKQKTGSDVIWPAPEPAPESERSGSA